MAGSSLRFTEEMAGHFTFGASDCERGAIAGRETGTDLRLRLTIEIDDLDRFALDANREASIAGWIDCDVLWGRLSIDRGVFNLLVGPNDAGRRRMLYRIMFRDGVEHPITLVGEKLVGPPGFHVWSDTTTMYFHLLPGEDDQDVGASPDVVAAGIVYLRPPGFLRQVTTFRATGRTPVTRVSTIARFYLLFARDLWRVYRLPKLHREPRRESKGGGS